MSRKPPPDPFCATLHWTARNIDELIRALDATDVINVPTFVESARASKAKVTVELQDTACCVEIEGAILSAACESSRASEGFTRVFLNHESKRVLKALFFEHRHRRRSDHTSTSNPFIRRHLLDRPTTCFVNHGVDIHPSDLLEVSDGGAFLAVTQGAFPPGATIAFCDGADDTWHDSRVRWRGKKYDRWGIGVQLRFRQPGSQRAWQQYIHHQLTR